MRNTDMAPVLQLRPQHSEAVRAGLDGSTATTAAEIPAEPPPVTVILALRNHVERLGISQLLQDVDLVRSCRAYGTVADAVMSEGVMSEEGVSEEGVSDAGAFEAGAFEATSDTLAQEQSTVLIVALREIEEADRAVLAAAARHGVKLLALLDDDLCALRRLAGISNVGMVALGDLSAPSLRTALARLHDGEVPIPPAAAHFLVSAVGEKYGTGPARTGVRMTPREQEVLVLLVEGFSNKQIARRMSVSLHGAKRHVANVLAKLDCANRTLAVARALREGLYERCLTQRP